MNFMDLLIYLTRKMATFSEDDKGSVVTWQDVPAEYKDQIEELRSKIVEKAADLDDKLAERFLNEEEISIDEIKAALRKGTIERKVTPAFCGTAFKNKGVQLLLDAVIDYLPSPLDIPPVEGIVPGTDRKEVA